MTGTSRSRFVIRRDNTFDYDGEAYQCTRLGPYGSGDDAWQVWRVRDGRIIDDGDNFDRLADVREHVQLCAENGWPLIAEPDDVGEGNR